MPKERGVEVTPFVGVWIETFLSTLSGIAGASHPSWVCGLKLGVVTKEPVTITSHPSWVCGLKLFGQCQKEMGFGSHPSWVCGLKPEPAPEPAPDPASHPSWVCGLKLRNRTDVVDGESHTLRGCVD